MATPLEMNTTELEGLLQDVYNLPDRGSGGSSEPDLVIEVDVSDSTKMDGHPEKFSFDPAQIVSAYTKLLNGETFNAILRLKYWPDSGGWSFGSSPLIHARGRNDKYQDGSGYAKFSFFLQTDDNTTFVVWLWFIVSADLSSVELSTVYARRSDANTIII